MDRAMEGEELMQAPILITGCARSGTSMVAGAINICGAFGGNMAGPNANNKKGMFENHQIRNNLTKPYLRNLGLDPLGQYPLPDVTTLPIPANWRQQVEKVMQEQGYTSGAWFYKGAKMCLTWPVWHHAFPKAKWVIVRRRTPDIINSCMKTSFMKAFSREEFRKAIGVENEQEGWMWWVLQHEKRFIEMLQAGVDAKIVWPERMVNGDYQQMMEIVEWAGLEWNSEVLSFVDPKLWKSRRK